MENTANQDLLQDIEHEWQEDASTGQRFGNYIIDLISFYLLWLAVVFTIVMIDPYNGFIASLEGINTIIDRLITLIFFGFYIMIIEGITKGRTLGKVITGTRAVRYDNEPFTWGDAIKRGFSRMVPFEQLSGFGGHPWHDQWTDTRVVKVKQ